CLDLFDHQKMLNCLLAIVAIVIFPTSYMACIKQPFLLIKANGGSRQSGLFCQFVDFHKKSPSKGLDLQVYFMVYTLNVEQHSVKSKIPESFFCSKRKKATTRWNLKR